jgi:hypothetical protein
LISWSRLIQRNMDPMWCLKRRENVERRTAEIVLWNAYYISALIQTGQVRPTGLDSSSILMILELRTEKVIVQDTL